MLSVIVSVGCVVAAVAATVLTVRDRRRADAACERAQRWAQVAVDAEARTKTALAALQEINGRRRPPGSGGAG